ncbi:MAG: Holliday junction branch migration DNA helicase RuvB [Lentisphaerae bacterium]|nr:Holliday junction branch migration DNA helicase RuvB [Lentisphaerota bacterium]
MTDSLRPQSFADFVGQGRPKKVLEILCRSAKKRGGCVPHVLLSGPPGLGKTTLARIIAAEMQTRMIEVVASRLQSPDEIVGHLKGIRKGDVLFIDEIHGLPRSVEEALYGAMEEFRIAVPQAGFDSLMKQLGMGVSKPTMQTLDLPRFTVIGATTLAGLISDPLRSRFAQQVVLEPYSEEDLATIVLAAARKMDFPLAPEVAMRIAGRSRQTARIAVGYLQWLAEYCRAADQSPSVAVLDEAFALKDIDEEGLTRLDRQYLQTLIDAGCPLGLSTLAAQTGESPETLAQAVEPFLIRKGYVRKGPRGRVALPKALDKVGKAA